MKMFEVIKDKDIHPETKRPTWMQGESVLLSINSLHLKCAAVLQHLAYTPVSRISLTTHRILWREAGETYADSHTNGSSSKEHSTLFNWCELLIHKVKRAELVGTPLKQVKTYTQFLTSKKKSNILHSQKLKFEDSSGAFLSFKAGDQSFVIDKPDTANVLQALFQIFEKARRQVISQPLVPPAESVESGSWQTGGLRTLIQKHEDTLRNQREIVADALQDLEALRRNAEEMSRLSGFLKQQMKNVSSSDSDTKEIDEIALLLNQLGIADGEIQSHATRAATASLDNYFKQLESDVEAFLQHILVVNPQQKKEKATNTAQGSMISDGMVLLHDLYCMFNRIRGTDLISAEDMLYTVTSLTHSKSSKWHLKQFFNKRITAVQLADTAENGFYKRLLALFEQKIKAKNSFSQSNNNSKAADEVIDLSHDFDKMWTAAEEAPKTALNAKVAKQSAAFTHFYIQANVSPQEVAHVFNITYMLAAVQLKELVEKGLLCVDEHIEGIFYYLNVFSLK